MPVCQKHLHQNPGARVGFGLSHDVTNMLFDRGQGKRQDRRNFLVGPTTGETLKHPVLALGELKPLCQSSTELCHSSSIPFYHEDDACMLPTLVVGDPKSSHQHRPIGGAYVVVEL